MVTEIKLYKLFKIASISSVDSNVSTQNVRPPSNVSNATSSKNDQFQSEVKSSRGRKKRKEQLQLIKRIIIIGRTQKQVLIWLKQKLKESKIDKQVAFEFLKYFAKKNVDGNMIYQWKQINNNDLTVMNEFIADFGEKNWSQNIWSTVGGAIKELAVDT